VGAWVGAADNRNWRWDVIGGHRIYSQSNLCLPHIAKHTFGRRGRINQLVILLFSQRAIVARLLNTKEYE
jgi:hypothetical protein